MWDAFYRKDLFLMGNNTTNRLERYHSTLKKTMQHRQLRFPELLQILLDISLLCEEDGTRKGLKSLVWFPTGVLDSFMQKMTKTFTPFASKLIADQYHAPKGLCTFITVRDF
jgi:hypothetical protein